MNGSENVCNIPIGFINNPSDQKITLAALMSLTLTTYTNKYFSACLGIFAALEKPVTR